ncbi:hypothetical protein D3C86_2000260 [compost metagenome]
MPCLPQEGKFRHWLDGDDQRGLSSGALRASGSQVVVTPGLRAEVQAGQRLALVEMLESQNGQCWVAAPRWVRRS